ncbi:ribokinase [Halovenus aranensis]|uniref:Ribokinase n=1 Tax=Halovenus aranensis TaxID=890420 RepID=A0A1G8VBK5_9EURY|nr:carbohydrate kinase family protein [Halovenus aranensis]SDJ63448.1 ribokinase [Halovenus aranensis]
MGAPRVVCAGHVNWDVTLYVDRLPSADGEAAIVDQHQSGGGSASNTAFVLSTLGLSSVLVGSTGEDKYGSLVREELAEAGVDTTHLTSVPGAVTTVKYLVVDESGQVMVLANDGANEAFDTASVPDDAIERADHLHLTSQRPETAQALAERAVEAGVPVSFDPGRRLDCREYEPVFRLADVVLLNESEAAATKQSAALESRDGITVIKRGSDGATATVDGRAVAHDGFGTEPVDTTGAGDAFAAGFIAGQLDGTSLETAVAVGNACGALATQTAGARVAITWDDIEDLLDRTVPE